MSLTKQLKSNGGESILLNIDEILQSVEKDGITSLANVINEEIGSRKLSKEEIVQLQEIMSVDALEGAKWKNVADVLKYISVFAVAESHPEDVKKIMGVLLTIIGMIYPAANSANGILAKVPDKVFVALTKIGGLATPEYLIYKGINVIAKKKMEKAKGQVELDTNVQDEVATLIVVCRNKLLSAEVIKIIEAKDDIDNETIVGVKDGTVQTILWNEAAWETFHKKLSGTEKVLIIDNIKHTESLTAQQIRFEKFGVRYGWNGNVARIEANPKVLKEVEDYQEFLAAMETFEISEKLKKNVKLKFDWKTAGKLAVFPPLLIVDFLNEEIEVKKQQLVFGLYNFYMQELAEFLKQEE